MAGLVSRDEQRLLADVVLDKKNGLVYVNGMPIDGYIEAGSIEAIDLGNIEEIETIELRIFVDSIRIVDNYQAKIVPGSNTGMQYIGLPTLKDGCVYEG